MRFFGFGWIAKGDGDEINASKELAVRNYEQAKLTDWKSETITGK